jgi:hypothetical protein
MEGVKTIDGLKLVPGQLAMDRLDIGATQWTDEDETRTVVIN